MNEDNNMTGKIYSGHRSEQVTLSDHIAVPVKRPNSFVAEGEWPIEE